MTSICFYTPHYFYLYYRDLKGFIWVKRRCCNSAEFILCLGRNSREDFALVEILDRILPWWNSREGSTVPPWELQAISPLGGLEILPSGC